MTFELQRDSRVLLCLTNAVRVSLPIAQVDIILDTITDDDFLKTKETIELLGNDLSDLKCKKDVGEFAYSIKAGSKNSELHSLTDIFTGEGFSQTPIIIEELENILQKYTMSKASTFKP